MRWTKEMLQYLTNNYNVLSISEIAKNMNLTKASVSCKASKLGLTKKDKGNEDIFANINNELSAYWLGFIYADGTAHGARSWRSHTLRCYNRFIIFVNVQRRLEHGKNHRPCFDR